MLQRMLMAQLMFREETRESTQTEEQSQGRKNVLCQLAASSKGNIDTNMKNFLESLVQGSFTAFGEKFCQQFSDRLGKIETEVTQLRTALERTQQFETVVTDRAIQIGPSMLDDELAGRIMSASSWLKNYYVDRVAFMTCIFSDLIAKDYQNFGKGTQKYTMDPLLLEYGKGGVPSHGRTRMLWNIDVDRIKRIKEVEAFAHLIPRIVKAVQSLTIHKHLVIIPYTVSYVPMSGLNRLNCHCGVYTIKHIECHVLGLDISLVSDDNIWGARIKIVWDLWEAANDQS
ncbi:hypothetical protein F2Q68_00030157 [Brassica cretica]|uniref:Uncharacterized protein n=1 Tax=Brassica cretica TaxID=69181 RepID=A0A8S9G8U0_BRACR|nr:hypothetical protein F2Q68_00030157 [Brassica cretica]